MTVKGSNELTEEILEEYRICRSTAGELEGNVYRTATIFGIGSAAAIALVTQGFGILATDGGLSSTERLMVVVLAASLAIAGWLTWWRMAERWRSVAWAMIIRMRHIERLTGMRANLYVAALDDYKEIEAKRRSTADRRVEFVSDPKTSDFNNPHLDTALEENLKAFLEQHEYRGIRPMIDFLVWINVAAWGLLFTWILLSAILQEVGSQILFPQNALWLPLLLVVAYSAAFLGLLRAHWRRP